MNESDIPATTAVRALKAAGVAFQPRLYRYEEHGGTARAAASLQVPEHAVIKTLVLEAQDGGGSKHACVVLMHGDREVSTKKLARILGVKTVSPASEEAVTKHTGYVPGGVSPFGTRRRLPVYAESTLLALERIYINGGRRGMLVEIDPKDIAKVLEVTAVEVAVDPHSGRD